MPWWVQVVYVELAVTALAGIAFVIVYGIRSPWSRTPLGRHLMAFAAIGTLDAIALIALGLGVLLSPIAYVLLYGIGAAVTVQRLALFLGVQRSARRRADRLAVTSHPEDAMADHVNTETAQAAARSRAWRTFMQGLGTDVAAAVLLAVGPALVGGDFAFSKAYWLAMAGVVAKTVVMATASYLMRRFGQRPDAPA